MRVARGSVGDFGSVARVRVSMRVMYASVTHPASVVGTGGTSMHGPAMT